MAPTPQAFAGSLSGKNKAEIVDILKALDQDTTGLKAELEDRLEQYLQDNEATLREDGQFKGLYVARRKRRSPRDDSATPSVRATPSARGTRASEDLDALKTATGNLAGKAYDAAATTYDQSVRPTLNNALEEGQEIATRSAKRVYKKVKDVTGLDEDSLRIPDSPTRALRSQARPIIENGIQRARPIVEDGIQKARPVVEDGIQQAEHLRKMSVRYWRENGKREARQALRDVQAHLSTPVNLIKTMLFLEMVYLLYCLIPWHRKELQFPPSKFSFHAWDRFLYAMFWWMPEIKRGYYLPELFAMFRPSSNNAGAGFAMWLIYTVIPPFLLSHVITFLPQEPVKAPARNTRSASRNASISALPAWDPLVFCLIRLALVVFPITSASPDFFRFQLEAIGNLSGRALVTALTGGFVLAHRLAALAE